MSPLDHAMLGIAAGLSVGRLLVDIVNLPWERWFSRPNLSAGDPGGRNA